MDRPGCDEEKSQGIVTLQPGAWRIVRTERASEAGDSVVGEEASS
jgi:hypothetical protein